jgi:hypothetical protein
VRRSHELAGIGSDHSEAQDAVVVGGGESLYESLRFVGDSPERGR